MSTLPEFGGGRLVIRLVFSILFIFSISQSVFADQRGGGGVSANGGFIESMVWLDTNADAIRDKNETGVAGVSVSLLRCDGGFVKSVITDGRGTFSFSRVAEGCYRLRFAAMNGYRYCPVNQGSDAWRDSDADPATGLTSQFDIGTNEAVSSLDAGLVAVGDPEIGDRVWEDANANGVQDVGEVGLGDVSVALLDCAGNAVNDTAGNQWVVTTDSDGFFVFEGLAADCYAVEITAPTDYLFSERDATHDLFDSDADPLTGVAQAGLVGPGQGLFSIDAGVYRTSTIGDWVWVDENLDHVQGDTEPGLADVQVLLLDANGVPLGQSVQSDADGYYEFTSVTPGFYRLQFVLPEGYSFGHEGIGLDDELDSNPNGLGITPVFEVVSGGEHYDKDAAVRDNHFPFEITAEKLTNGVDADTAPGPYIEVGDNVLWEYVLTNTGTDPLYAISAIDNQGVSVSCPQVDLLPGETMTCTGTGIAQAGQYQNEVYACGRAFSPTGGAWCDKELSHYFGSAPGISLEKLTNGQDADTPTGPLIPLGGLVTWEYFVLNTGNVTLTDVNVIDDQGVTVTCPSMTLDPGVSMTCTATGTAVSGQYSNLGTVTGTPPVGDPVTDDDPSHYFGEAASISIEKATNGVDADTPTGPAVLVGSTVNWTYLVTNTGTATLTDIVVTDDQGVAVSCPATTLAPGDSFTCTASGIATEGQYANIGSVVGTPPVGDPVSDIDPSHYIGVTPSIDIEKATNGEDADTPTGPTVAVGSTVNWTYVVTNTGPITLIDIVVTDDQGVAVSCPATTLAPGDSFTCTASGIATVGQYANLGSVTGQGVDPAGDPVGDPVSDIDPSHYIGVTPSIDIEKATNGEDADTPTGPTVAVGSTVNWTYLVTNTGPITLIDIVVTDDQGVAVSCPATTLAPGDSFTCTASGIATVGQYANLGSVTGQGVDPAGDPIGDPVSDIDPSHYIGVTPSIDIEKATNGEDADTPTGPTVAVGSTVNWTYLVTNTGPITLIDIVVTDDQGVAVSCPATTLAPGDSFTCTASGIATAGQYANLGSVTGQGVDPAGDPVGDPVSDIDPSHYIGVTPSIDIEKATNGVDADTPTGPTVAVGSTVNWTYLVTNTGPITLIDIVVTDDQGVTVSCPATTLAPGDSFTCTASGIATVGQYANLGSVTGQGVDPAGNPIGDPVSDIDPSHYIGVTPSIDIEKATNGEDADTPTGPTVAVGSIVNWTYLVTNTGPITLIDIVVTDDQGVTVSCPATTLAPGDSFTCTASGIATAGQYANLGSVTGQGVDPAGNPIGDPVSDIDPSHYIGVAPSIDIEKATNGEDADTPTGPTVAVGSTVNWTYLVTNTGPITLIDIVVTDDQGVAVSCPATTLAPGDSFTCTASGIATVGQYANLGSVTGQGVDPAGDPVGDPVSDIDPSHYIGVTPSIDIEKATNGEDADTPTGPTVAVGSTVNWTYLVTNTGPITLIDIVVTDDQGVAVSCPATTLLPGASFTCTASGIATSGQYANLGSVTGQGVDPAGNPIGDPVSDIDPSHYIGVTPSIDIEKATNGEDADTPTGPTVAVGSTVNWTYLVTNTGPITLIDIVVTDDQGVTVSCPATTLAPGDSFTCTASGIATVGQYANLGSVTGQGVDPAGDPVGDPVSDIDPSHYIGVTPSIDIEKATNGEDADTPTGPTVAVGSTVNWTYLVTNTGPITLIDIVVTDDQGVTVSCPATTLAPGDSFTCTASGIATVGQYANLGSVTGQGVDPAGNPIGDPVSDIDPSHYIGVTPSIDIEKATNGEDADTPTGPTVAVGSIVNWTYLVTNTGPITLIDIVVTDDQGVAVSCPATTLAPGDSFTCTASGIATVGQYANLGSVTGQGVDPAGDPVGDPVSDIDPSHYIGVTPSIDIEKATNGVDADTPTGPTVAVGSIVNWTYLVTNTGPITLIDIVVTDDQGVTVSCPATTLAPGDSFTCTASGIATVGQYANLGSVTGQGVDPAGDPVGDPVSDIDPSHYIGVTPSIDIEKATNGVDADTPTGPTVAVGSIVNWTYLVTNTGPITLIDIVVTDDQGVTVSCPATTLAPGDSFTCTASGIATVGQYANLGSVTGQGVDPAGDPIGDPVSDIDPSHYIGVTPSIDIEKATNGEDADTPTGPTVAVGSIVNWTYLVTNTGPITLIDIVVTDDQGVTVSCPATTLAPGDSFTCTASGIATVGQYANLGSVTGQGVDPAGDPIGDPVSDIDPSHYIGVTPSIDIEKATNGVDADTPTGPTVAVGSIVNWTYLVTNTGPITLIDIVVTDDQGVTVSCPATTLAPGDSFTCTASGIATVGQYANLGSVTGQGVDPAGDPVGDPVSDIDPSHYIGVTPSIDIEKATNGEDADTPTGPSVLVGSTVNWTYLVTNTGPITLIDIVVTDDQGVAVSCPATTLAPGDSFTCTGTGIAQAGQYANIGSVTGQGVDPAGDPVGDPVSDIDPSHYLGLELASLGDKVFKDLNADGQQDAGEPGVAGITVNLWTDDDGDGTPDTLIATTVTDADGMYGFAGLDPMLVYVVQFINDPAMNMPFTTPNIGSDMTDSDAGPGGFTGPITLTSGENNPTIDAGLVNLPASLGDKVFKDLDADGQQDPGEPGIPGITVNLWTDDDGDGTPDTLIASTATDAFGMYGFANLDPMMGYVIQFINDPAMNMPFTVPNVGSDITDSDAGPGGFTGPITLTSGENNPTIDAGLVNLPASLGDKVFKDLDADGQQDPGEPGIPGITVNLWTDDDGNSTPDTLIATTVTDADGMYSFTGLDPTLVYVVGFVNDPAMNMPFTTPNMGDDNTDSDAGAGGFTVPITLSSGENNPTIDAGLVNLPASLGDFVWIDLDRDGVQDAGEPGIPGAIVNLWTDDDGDGTPDTLIATTTTDANGMYIFEGLDNSTIYIVQFEAIPGKPFTVQGAGGDPTLDSNPNVISGFTGPITLLSGEYNPTIDAGVIMLAASIDIEKATNGEDADTPTGPVVGTGSTVNWTYVVTNTGELTLINVMVSDNQGVTVTCPTDTLAPGANMTCTASGIAIVGQYANLGSVIGQPTDGGVPVGDPVSDVDPSHYFGANPDVQIIKYTNGDDANDAPGPTIAVGDAVTWIYVVTNTGNVTLFDILVSDDQGVAVTCPVDSLAPGATTVCVGNGIATPGQYMNVGEVCANDGAVVPTTVCDDDPSHYFGAQPAIDLEKSTNGVDADIPTGPAIMVGDPVTWTYTVTNIGNVTLFDLALADDQGVAITCPVTSLAPGASVDCIGTGIATLGQYANLGTVCANDGAAVPTTVCDEDPSHYFGVLPGIQLEKATNGEDADTPMGPSIPTGDLVTWTYVVTNTGNVTLFDLAVTDDQGVVVTCPVTTLAPGASTTCIGTGIAIQGQYANLGTVCANDGAGDPTTVCDDDPSHYFGLMCEISVDATCLIPMPPAMDYVCDSPIDTLNFIWDGASAVRIKAWKGDVGSELLADIDNIAPGEEISVSGFAGSPNDVYFEVFDAGTNTKIGESNFHLSCSDDEMDGPEDCGMAQGNGKGNDSSLINDWLLEGIVDQGGTLDCTPPNVTGSDSCEFQSFPASCDTIDNVDTMTLVYTGGTCGDSQNDQGDKFDCLGTVDGTLPALVTLEDGSTFTVNPGEAFTIPESGSGTVVSLSNSGGTMDLDIHTSCSAPLATGDVYGATTLQLINNMGGGTDVIYGYTITNNGDNQITSLSVIDTVLGPISGAPATLDPGEMVTLFSTAFVNTTTNSSVIVDAIDIGGASCSAVDSVDVTILPPPPCDITGEGVLDISGDTIKWKLENVGVSSAKIESITITWPEHLNGNLKEVKFNGTKIYNTLTSGGTVTLGPGDWIDDPNKRVIDPGNIETLEIKFDQNSDGQATQADYGITVNFEEGCSVTYVNTGLPFECNGPINELSMIWDGAAEPIQVKAWKGDVGSELLLDQSGIIAGTEVTVSGYAGSPNDVYWEIFSGGSKIGESNFHMSCSDNDMNGADDCGKRQGDGKGNDASFINDWLLEGMVDDDGPFDCTP